MKFCWLTGRRKKKKATVVVSHWGEEFGEREQSRAAEERWGSVSVAAARVSARLEPWLEKRYHYRWPIFLQINLSPVVSAVILHIHDCARHKMCIKVQNRTLSNLLTSAVFFLVLLSFFFFFLTLFIASTTSFKHTGCLQQRNIIQSYINIVFPHTAQTAPQSSIAYGDIS